MRIALMSVLLRQIARWFDSGFGVDALAWGRHQTILSRGPAAICAGTFYVVVRGRFQVSGCKYEDGSFDEQSTDSASRLFNAVHRIDHCCGAST
jgi:hypothetical protein